jgi:hypothetical protein
MPNSFEVTIIDARKAARKFEWGEVVGSRKIFACHSAQLDVLGSSAKITAAIAGAQGGKTALIPLRIFKEVAKLGGVCRVLHVAPTYKVIQQSNIVRGIETLFAGTPYAGRYHKQEATYRWDNGEILIRTTEVEENLDAGVYDIVIIDEAAKVSNNAWQRLVVRAAAKDAPILLVTTPDLDNFVTDLFNQTNAIDGDEYKRHSDDGTIYIRRWKSIDRPGFSQAAYDAAKKTMSPAFFARMFDGEYATLEGLVYASFSNDKDPAYPVIDSDKLPSKPVTFYGGNDWGYNPDPASVLLIAQCEDGCHYVCEEIYGTEITPDEMARRVRALVDKWAVRVDSQYADFGGTFSTFWTDVSRPEQTAMFRRVNISIRNKRVADIMAGLANVDSWFRAGRLKVLRTCPNLIRELRGYKWDSDRSGGVKNRPLGKNDHSCDALRYAISSQLYGETPTPIEARTATDDATERQKLVDYGVDANAIDERMKEDDAAREKERLHRMAFGTADDDDPYGVWQAV